MFYKNKIEHIRSIGFSLPKDVEYALSEIMIEHVLPKVKLKEIYLI